MEESVFEAPIIKEAQGEISPVSCQVVTWTDLPDVALIATENKVGRIDAAGQPLMD
ncbi:MAG: hypothetical protein M0036_16735 [Desulfobacteraceae bacterium]|nr:hypothetical protein [Desulfobacteraceae bacterium]